MSEKIVHTLIHPVYNLSEFASQANIWKQWEKNASTVIIGANDSLTHTSYLDSIPPNSRLMLGGQTADDCVERHLGAIAIAINEMSFNLIVALSIPATWSMDFYEGFDPRICSPQAVVERVNRKYGVKFAATRNS